MTTDHMELRTATAERIFTPSQEMIRVSRIDLAELLAAYDALRAGATVKRGKKEYPAEFSAAYDAMKDMGTKWREGSPLAASYDQWKKRVKAGADPEQILEGVRRYAAYIIATESPAKMAQTFFGPGEHYTAAWEVPRAAPRRALPDRRTQQELASQEALARLDGMPLFDPNVIEMEAPHGSR